MFFATKGMITDWRAVPIKSAQPSDGFYIQGIMNGKIWSTTAIVKLSSHLNRRFVHTDLNTVYELGKASSANWQFSFIEKRPARYAELKAAEFL